MRLRWRQWLLIFFFTFLFVVVYRVNRTWESANNKIDILREMQVYDNFEKLSIEYQNHISEESRKKGRDLEMSKNNNSNDVAGLSSNLHGDASDDKTQIKKDIEELTKFLSGPETEVLQGEVTEKKSSVTRSSEIQKGPDDVLAMVPPNYLPNYKNPCWYETNSTSKRLRCLPYFHLIGVDKSGTTDLWFRIIQHPQVLQLTGVLGKETHWWSWRRFGFDIWVRNSKIRSFDWYLQAFDKPAQKIESTVQAAYNISNYHPLITGEGSPTVFWDFTGWDMIPQNKGMTPEKAYLTPHCLHHLTPNTKLIVIFRNPTERLYSDYLFLARFRGQQGKLSAETFNYAVIQSMKMWNDCRLTHTVNSCLYNKTLHMHMPSRILVGMYAVYLREWLKVFSKDQIMILRNEDYSKDILGHIKQVYKFLGIKELSEQETERIASLRRQFTRTEKDRSVGPMWNQTRTVLNLFYKEANRDLASLLKDDRFLWNQQM